MPNRVGIDLVSVDEIRDSISTHGAHYLERVYSEREVADSRTAGSVDPERLAARFAAKEAAMKVLRARDHTGRAAERAAQAGITDLSLSLTHERGLASAVVVAEICKSADK